MAYDELFILSFNYHFTSCFNQALLVKLLIDLLRAKGISLLLSLVPYIKIKEIFMRLFLLTTAVLIITMFGYESVAQKDKHKKSKGTQEHAHLDIKDACKREESLAKIKDDMSPFRFDKVTTTRIHYKSYDKVWSVAIPLFYKTQYQFIFNTEGLPTNVEIKISDKPLQVSSAKILHQSSEKHFSYKTPVDFEGTRIYVSVSVPADVSYNTGVRNKGCVLMATGYQNVD